MRCYKRGDVCCGGADDCFGNRQDSSTLTCKFDEMFKAVNAYEQHYRLDELKDILRKDIPKKYEDLREYTIENMMSLNPWKRLEFKVAVKIENAKQTGAWLEYPNFIYDRRTQLVFFDFDCGAHDSFMRQLYILHKMVEGKLPENELENMNFIGSRAFKISEVSEKFVTEGCGFFSSAVLNGMGLPSAQGYPVIYSPDYKLNAQEKAVFKEYGFKPLEAN